MSTVAPMVPTLVSCPDEKHKNPIVSVSAPTPMSSSLSFDRTAVVEHIPQQPVFHPFPIFETTHPSVSLKLRPPPRSVGRFIPTNYGRFTNETSVQNELDDYSVFSVMRNLQSHRTRTSGSVHLPFSVYNKSSLRSPPVVGMVLSSGL
jgi:hypothetical protein